MEEWRYSTTLDGGEWSASRPCRFIPGGNSPRYSLYTSLGGSQIRYGRYGDEKNPLPLPGLEPRILSRAVRSPGTILTELSRLHACSTIATNRA
jgi:hypothetical protein